MSTRPSLTPLADLGRLAGQAPLHGLHAAGIAAAGDDAKVASSRKLRERVEPRGRAPAIEVAGHKVGHGEINAALYRAGEHAGGAQCLLRLGESIRDLAMSQECRDSRGRPNIEAPAFVT